MNQHSVPAGLTEEAPVAVRLAAFAAEAKPSARAQSVCRRLVFDIIGLAIAARETDYVAAALASAPATFCVHYGGYSCPSGSTDEGADLQAALSGAVGQFRTQDQLLRAGFSPLDSVRMAYWPELDPFSFAAQLSAMFRSQPGKRFLEMFNADPSPAGLQAARAAFFAALPGRRYIDLQEVFLVNMLTRQPDPA